MNKSRRGFLAALIAAPVAAVAATPDPVLVALENTLKFSKVMDQAKRGQTSSIYQIDELAYYRLDADDVQISISHADMQKLKFKVYDKDQFDLDRTKYPLNLYGEESAYYHTNSAILATKHLDPKMSARMAKEREAYDRLHGMKNA